MPAGLEMSGSLSLSMSRSGTTTVRYLVHTEAEAKPLLGQQSLRNKRLTILVIIVSNLTAWCCISLIAPFFPNVAAKKGANETIVGMIYSCSEVVIFLLSPVFGLMMGSYSPRFFYIAGLCVFGVCDVLFGFLDKSPSGTPFIAICFAVRIVEAMGTASIMTASFAIAGQTFPDKIGLVYSCLETVVGVGLMLGPAMGGALYEVGGFGLPFWLLGGLVFVCGCASCMLLPPQDCVKQEPGPSIFVLFKSPLVWLAAVSLCVALFALSVYSTTLSPYLLQFNVSESIIGLVFVVNPLVYAFSTPLWGIILDRQIPEVPIMFGGLISAGVVFLFFGPAPFLTFVPTALWVTVLTLAFLGLTLSPIVVSSMKLTLTGARDLGFKDNPATFGIVGALIQSSICLGASIGPTAGGLLTQNYGFGQSMVVTSLILLLPVVIFGPLFLARYCKRKQALSPGI